MNELITSSLATGVLNLLFDFPKELMSPTEVKIVDWIVKYTARFNAPPSIDRLQKEFPTFVVIHEEDPLGDIHEQTLTKKRNLYARQFILKIQDHLKAGADPLPYIEDLHQKIRGGDGNVTRYSTFDRSAYLRSPTSYPYEIDLLDQQTGGIASGDLIYLIGRLGTGKTTFALWVVSKWLQRERRILMISNENRADDVVAKIDSYLGRFNPLKKRTMAWTEEDKRKLDTVSYIARSMKGEVYIPNQPVKSVTEVKNLIYTYRPDIVVVDGIYLIGSASGDSHWEKMTNISRELKQIAEGEGVPVLGIHQANRQAIGKRIEIEHIAYADALAQDADLVMGINAEDDGNLYVESIKNRWGNKAFGFFLKIFFETMSVRILDPRVGGIA